MNKYCTDINDEELLQKAQKYKEAFIKNGKSENLALSVIEDILRYILNENNGKYYLYQCCCCKSMLGVLDIESWIEEGKIFSYICTEKTICSDCLEFIIEKLIGISGIEELIFQIKNQNAEDNNHEKEVIPNSIRWQVWERDNYTCQFCGRRNNLTVDHKHPEVKGGRLNIDNLQTLCKSCNPKKGSKILDLI